MAGKEDKKKNEFNEDPHFNHFVKKVLNQGKLQTEEEENKEMAEYTKKVILKE